MSRTVVGLYDDLDTARQVVQELENNGFRREDISLVAHDTRGQGNWQTTGDGEARAHGAEKGAGVGAVLGGLAGLLVGIGALAIPGVGPVIAAGALATTLAGAGVGAVAGGLIGALTEAGVPEEEANYYAEGVRRGGNLVTVTAPDNMEQQARDILDRFHPVDMHERSSFWKQDNWQHFDEQSSPYTEDQIRQERARYYQENRDVQEAQQSFHDPGTTFQTSNVGSDLGMTENDGCKSYADTFRNHYSSLYSYSGRPYEYYQPAYCYGYDLRNDPRFRNITDWSQLEPQTRNDWERLYPNSAWNDIKEAVRAGWESLTGA